MTDNRMLIVGTLLREVAEELDIPPSKYQQAVDRYRTVGSWLEDGDYPTTFETPLIYTQGSFRLGTVVRPLRGGVEAEYDIDLVCQIPVAANATSPWEIKHAVGDRLKAHGTYRGMLDDEGGRCWTLVYAENDGIGFHLDVLPCVPGPMLDAGTEHGLKAVKLTNRKDGGTTYFWGSSNPAGYADWFEERQRVSFSRIAVLRKSEIQRQYPRVFARVEDVPDQLVRTPLQRAIQILKRHRDVRFDGHPDERDKPISMIITTLATIAFDQEPDVFAALANFLDKVQRFQDTGIIQCLDDAWVIPNPVNPQENFADRWNEPGSRKADCFFQWINWVQEDIDDLLNAATAAELERRLRRGFGDTVGGRVARRYSGPMPGAYQISESAFRRVARRNLRFDVAHKQAPKWHVAARYSASIIGKYTRRGFRPTRFESNAPALPKNADLVFEVVTDVPKPFKVFWQVVNTGPEAARAGQLRGDFYDSNLSGRKRDESTKYTGMHWVECFVVKDNVCVARSGEFVVNIT